MSNASNRARDQRIAQFVVPEGEVIADFESYAAAVDCVDQLIRHDFPAPMVAIVGSDLRSVERVRAKMSYATVALRGAITGSWVGLVLDLLTSTTSTSAASSSSGSTGLSLPAAVFIGAGVGMLFNVIRFSFSRNRHEFSGASAVIASRYDIVVPHSLAQQAKDAIEDHRANCSTGK
jgi:hypothetical protein